MKKLFLLLTLALPIAAAQLTDINVRQYGALGNGSHDDTAGLQRAFDAAKSDGRAVYMPAGDYMISDSLDITAFRAGAWSREQFHLYGDGMEVTRIFCLTNSASLDGYPMLDGIGSMNIVIEDLGIFSPDEDNTEPSCGILLGRRVDNAGVWGGTSESAGEHMINRVRVTGDFTISCVYTIAAEVCRYEGCDFGAFGSVDNATPFYAGANATNVLGSPIISKYQTINSLGTGGCGLTRFDTCHFIVYNATNREDAAAIYIDSPQSLTFDNCILATYGRFRNVSNAVTTALAAIPIGGTNIHVASTNGFGPGGYMWLGAGTSGTTYVLASTTWSDSATNVFLSSSTPLLTAITAGQSLTAGEYIIHPGPTNQVVVLGEAHDIAFNNTRQEWAYIEPVGVWFATTNQAKGLTVRNSLMCPIAATNSHNLYGFEFINSTWSATNNISREVLNVASLYEAKFEPAERSGFSIGREVTDGIYHVREYFENLDFGPVAWNRVKLDRTQTNWFGVRIKNPNLDGTIQNNYALLIDEQTAGTALNYGIYSASPNPTYLGGELLTGANIQATLGVIAGSNSSLIVAGRSKLRSETDGQFHMVNNAGTSFTLLSLGPRHTNWPALKVTSTNAPTISFRDGADYFYTAIVASNVTVSGGTDTNATVFSDQGKLQLVATNDITFTYGGTNGAWFDAETGALLFLDATMNIGASGANRPKNIFLSGNAVIPMAYITTAATTTENAATLNATTANMTNAYAGNITTTNISTAKGFRTSSTTLPGTAIDFSTWKHYTTTTGTNETYTLSGGTEGDECKVWFYNSSAGTLQHTINGYIYWKDDAPTVNLLAGEINCLIVMYAFGRTNACWLTGF